MRRTIACITCLMAACVLLAACEDNDDALTTQRQRIVSYLTSSHVPQLVSEE